MWQAFSAAIYHVLTPPTTGTSQRMNEWHISAFPTIRYPNSLCNLRDSANKHDSNIINVTGLLSTNPSLAVWLHSLQWWFPDMVRSCNVVITALDFSEESHSLQVHSTLKILRWSQTKMQVKESEKTWLKWKPCLYISAFHYTRTNK